jgi:neutral ceramidase
MKKVICRSIFALIILSLCTSLSLFRSMPAERKGWKAGVARQVITPESPMWLAGYSRDHPSEGTLVDLWAKVLVLEDSTGNRSVLVTTDILGFPKNVSDNIRNKLRSKYGFDRARIILSSSHTHTGPVMHNDFHIYTQDPAEVEKIRIYSLKLEDRIVSLAGDALRSMVPVKLYARNGITRFQVNRRNNTESKLDALTELKGPNDYAVPVIKVESANGDILAIVFGYACHATVLNTYKFSGDYPGFAQLELERLHPGATAMYFQGAGADQNPLPRRTVPLAQQYGKELAYAVDRVLSEDMHMLPSGISAAYSEVPLKIASAPSKEELLKTQAGASEDEKYWAGYMLAKLKRGESFIKSYPYPVQVWKLGDQPLFILGGELVIDYAIGLKKLYGQDIFIMGYSNDVMGYIPSLRVLKEGGYEGASSQMVYGMPGPWAADIEDIIMREARRVAEKAGVRLK